MSDEDNYFVYERLAEWLIIIGSRADQVYFELNLADFERISVRAQIEKGAPLTEKEKYRLCIKALREQSKDIKQLV